MDGVRVDFRTPREALAAGVFMVHQHFKLVEPFTVAENIILGDTRGEGRHFRLRTAAIENAVVGLGERYGLAVDPRVRIWQLSVGEQQRVEILKALYWDARLLDPRRADRGPDAPESDALFMTLRQMADEGRTIIFISHKLQEVVAVSDRVTVLRAGRSVGTMATAGATPRSLATMMVDRDVDLKRVQRTAVPTATVLELDGVSAVGDRGTPALSDVALTLHAGEILAIAGVAGNGQRELAEVITGLRERTGGTITIGDSTLETGPRAAIRAGIAHIPEDRLGTGVAGSLPLYANVSLKDYRSAPYSRGPFLSIGHMRDRARELIGRYEVKTPGTQVRTRNLSGGNLQKIIVGRELGSRPRVVVAASPTRGLDVGAIEAVHGYLRDAADAGVGVLLISEDLDEILVLADRVAVIYEGRIVGLRDATATSRDDIGLLMAGG